MLEVQLLRRKEKQFRGGLVFKARRLVVSLNSRPRVIKKKKKKSGEPRATHVPRPFPCPDSEGVNRLFDFRGHVPASRG